MEFSTGGAFKRPQRQNRHRGNASIISRVPLAVRRVKPVSSAFKNIDDTKQDVKCEVSAIGKEEEGKQADHVSTETINRARWSGGGDCEEWTQ